ncbi:MAG: BamA/TamA family outer membrane protein [Spirochaetales bacterium]|nr:BamA/TamA family outer membrane protein [Spirochaetales bacterium]MCF7938546.1 BamA/TamA family outer membrane protein [Spirochaetales bacterium]
MNKIAQGGYRTFLFLISFMLCFWIGQASIQSVWADNSKEPAERQKTSQSGYGRWDLIPLPFAFYTSDTGLAGGGMLVALYTDDCGNEAASFQLSGTYSMKQQGEVTSSWSVTPAGGKTLVEGELSYFDTPAKFYGIGSEQPSREILGGDPVVEEYRAARFESALVVLFRGGQNFWCGPLFEYGRESFTGYTEGGAIANQVEKQGLINHHPGVGFQFRFDSRDNQRYPSQGMLVEVQSLYFDPVWGAADRFIQNEFDLRGFVSPLRGLVLGVRGYGMCSFGNVPLARMAELGGLFLMRGYPYARYVAENALVMQMELRFPVYGRLKGAIFAAAGNVARSPAELFAWRESGHELKYSGGAGLRFALNREGRVHIRLDYGISPEGSGLYITLMEAF